MHVDPHFEPYVHIVGEEDFGGRGIVGYGEDVAFCRSSVRKRGA
ncbi:hypothetical protein [Mesorhizobium sp. WSM1497]|nr:hypothetical protein [Mesorhizobium sp. WSM1497]